MICVHTYTHLCMHRYIPVLWSRPSLKLNRTIIQLLESLFLAVWLWDSKAISSCNKKKKEKPYVLELWGRLIQCGEHFMSIIRDCYLSSLDFSLLMSELLRVRLRTSSGSCLSMQVSISMWLCSLFTSVKTHFYSIVLIISRNLPHQTQIPQQQTTGEY